MYDFAYIHKLESQSKWREAEKEWSKTEYGKLNHASACKMIADAIERGDAIREKDRGTIYTIIESKTGYFSYRSGYYDRVPDSHILGRVYGIVEATETVVSLNENRNEIDRIITGFKMDFPELN